MNDHEILEVIRNQLVVCDEKTGLKGNDLPIYLMNSLNIMGQFHYNCKFGFNRPLFTDPDPAIKDNDLISYVILHEYAHYINYAQYGETGHGWWFKHCCKMLDTYPDEYLYDLLRQFTAKWSKLSEMDVKDFISRTLPKGSRKNSLYNACTSHNLNTMFEICSYDFSDLRQILMLSSNVGVKSMELFSDALNEFKHDFFSHNHI